MHKISFSACFPEELHEQLNATYNKWWWYKAHYIQKYSKSVPTAHAQPYLKTKKRLMEDKWKNTSNYLKSK